MDGPAHRGTRGRGRSSRGASSSPARVAASVGASGSTARGSSTSTTTDPARLAADTLVTRSTYRHLLMKGLSPEEAANLTAFMCGIPVDQVRWSLRQINQLLFLRELARSGRFGARDGGPPRPY